MKPSVISSSELINIIIVVILVLLSCLFEARRGRPGVSWVMDPSVRVRICFYCCFYFLHHRNMNLMFVTF